MSAGNKKLLYLFVYGNLDYPIDKGFSNNRHISDGGNNIHFNFLDLQHNNYDTTIFSQTDNKKFQFWFGKYPNVTIKSFVTLSSVFKINLMTIETLTRCIYPGLFSFFYLNKFDIVISSSDFLPDVFSGFIYKLVNPSSKWVASFFLRAPNPFSHSNPYKSIARKIIGLGYWLQQALSLPLLLNANKYIVTSLPDKDWLISKGKLPKNILVIQGGVRTESAMLFLKSKSKSKKLYDACFLGRLHDQKGVLLLVDIWKKVVQTKPNAKLAIIGNGPLKVSLENKIKDLRLGGNIALLGQLHGEKKYSIFKNTKIVLHPATYDSGGMAAAEAMAFGLPGVSFDLDSLKTYYPKGMIKTRCFDLDEFSKNILLLLNDKNLYKETSASALKLIQEKWDWKKRSLEMNDFIYH